MGARGTETATIEHKDRRVYFRQPLTKGETTKRIGKYEILRELGRGAMGVVFKARDPLIGRLVALKTIALAASESEDLRQRFYREAQAAGGLQHPNIVTVYEMGEENCVPFIAMEYLEGESLDSILSRKTQIPLAQKLGYVVQVCRALSYAHQHGTVHRDIKPGNIMVTRDGTAKVVDFGIARMVDTSKTQTGVLLGTLAYMSPQLVKGERADERSDIWATGVVCYELFAGLKPFDGNNHAALLMSIVSDEPRSLAKLAPDCPEELRAIIEKMLRKKAEERYQTFEELLRAIEPIWRRHQRECVDFLLAQSRDLIRQGELPQARKILLQARLVDATRTFSRDMLEKVNAALKDKILPAEVDEHLERARNLRSEGLLEEARAAAESALELDSKSESARKIVAEIDHEIARLEETAKSQRQPALERLLTAMRAAIQRGDPREAIRLGREALGRAGHETRVSELIELAELHLREGAGIKASAGVANSRDVEIELYPKDDGSEELIREYVFEQVGPQTGKSETSMPPKGAQAGTVPRRSVDSSVTVPSSPEQTVKKQTGQRSGTMVIPQAAQVSPAHGPWKKPILYVSLALVLGGATLAGIKWKSWHSTPASVQTPTAQTEPVKPDRPTAPVVQPPPERAESEGVETTPIKNEEDELFAQAQQLAQTTDSANLRQAQHLLERVIAAKSPHRVQAEQLRNSVLQRLSKNDQDLQRNQEFANLAAEARRDLDAGDPTAARGRLSDIQKLGGNDENLAAEIARTERVRFGSLESEYQQDAQNTDERARNHLVELQRQFRVLAQGGGPLADKASNYAENLIPAKLADIAGKNAAAKNDATVADDQAFDAGLREYKKASEARDANSLKALVLPKFQAIALGNSLHKAEAAQYVEKLIPAAIREFAPHPAIGCAQVPPGLLPSIKPGDLVACGLLDQPRLKWVQFAWPEFPAQARQAGQTKGIAMLMLTVDQNGSVVDVKTRGRADAYGFSDAAIQAVKNWKTNPPRAQGKPVRTEFSVDLLFAQ